MSRPRCRRSGRLAFTLYVAHALTIAVPVGLGLWRGMPIEFAFAFGLAFYAIAIAFAMWWRARWELGPLEGLMRRVTRRPRTQQPWTEPGEDETSRPSRDA